MIDPHALRTLIEQWRKRADLREKHLVGLIKDNCINDEDCQEAVRDCANELEALLSALPETPWQPMSTAPTDGTNILLFVPHYAMGRIPSVTLQGWNLAEDRRGWRSQYAGGEIHPTHWMPLPAPPPPSEETT
jgi:hypothetical protein